MRILLSNDDGYASPLLQALAAKLSANHETCVVAPLSNQSGTSSSLSISEPTVVKMVDGMRIVSGTPTDCVHLALTVPGILPWDSKPDLTVSGINLGRNLGNDALCSGTIAAAAESVAYGVPAVALSLHCSEARAQMAKYFDDAVAVAHELVIGLQDRLLAAPGTLLSVNLPCRPRDEIKEPVACRLGLDYPMRRIAEEPAGAPSSAHECYRVGELKHRSEHEAGTDYALLAAGHVTITPLRFDMTHDKMLPAVASWLE